MGDGYLVDKILDKTGMKGTGAMAVLHALETLEFASVEHRRRDILLHYKRHRTHEHCSGSHQASGPCSRQRSFQWRRPPLRPHWMAASCRA